MLGWTSESKCASGGLRLQVAGPVTFGSVLTRMLRGRWLYIFAVPVTIGFAYLIWWTISGHLEGKGMLEAAVLLCSGIVLAAAAVTWLRNR
jgi:hypothetical protein